MLTRLTLETSRHHAGVDEALYGTLEFLNMSGYRRFLCTLYGFQAPLEAMLLMTPGIDLAFVQARVKAGRIAGDLLALGLTAKEFRMLTRRHAVPVLRGVPEAFGWLYVCERMTLQHEALRDRLAVELPIALDLGGSYLWSYEGTAAVHWRELGAMLDDIACSSEAADRVVAGANEAFASLGSWLGEHAPAAIRAPRLRAS